MNLNQIIKEITDAYNFPVDDINSLLESVLKYTLMEQLKKDVDVFLDKEGVEAYLYRDSLDGTRAERVDFSRLNKDFYRKLYQNLKYYLELRKKSLELEIVRTLQGRLVGGYILEKFNDRYTVRLAEHPLDDLEVVIERRYWIPGETMLIGEHYFFLCRKVRVIAGVLPRLVMFLSRTSINLPALLLEVAFREKTGMKTKCKCIKRVAGKFSFLKCKTRVSEDLIRWVSRNLNNEKIIISKF